MIHLPDYLTHCVFAHLDSAHLREFDGISVHKQSETFNWFQKTRDIHEWEVCP